MQTKYEQITELRETAPLINQLEFKIQFNSNSIEQLTKYNSHKENTDLINELTAITDRLKTDLQKHKEVFDLLLSNIKPYQSKEVERELKVGDIFICHSTHKLKSTIKIGSAYTIDRLKEYGYSIVILVGNDEVYFEQNNTIDQYYWKKYFTLK